MPAKEENLAEAEADGNARLAYGLTPDPAEVCGRCGWPPGCGCGEAEAEELADSPAAIAARSARAKVQRIRGHR